MGRTRPPMDPPDDSPLVSALATMGDDDASFSREVETYLDTKTLDELWGLVEQGERLRDAVKIRNGFVYLALKRQVGHSFFKKAVAERGRKYAEVWDCMCYARAVQRFPGFAGKLTGHAMRHVLALPTESALQIESDITGLPPEEAKKITREAIEVEYDKIQAEKRRPPKERPPVEVEIEISALDGLLAQAVSALSQIGDLPLTAAVVAEAARARDLLSHAWDRAQYNMYDPTHQATPPWALGNSDDISTDDEEGMD